MKKTTAAVLILSAASMLTGCEGARQALTQTKAGPDEFAVYTRAPLTIPPDYGLRPPSDGKTAETGSVTTREQSRRVLLGSSNRRQPVQGSTPGTSALLAMANAGSAEPGIRDLIENETSAYANKDVRFMEKLLYGDAANGTGTLVDPLQEQRRIQENQALGKAITEGETPMIDTKPTSGIGSVINGWFK